MAKILPFFRKYLTLRKCQYNLGMNTNNTKEVILYYGNEYTRVFDSTGSFFEVQMRKAGTQWFDSCRDKDQQKLWDFIILNGKKISP